MAFRFETLKAWKEARTFAAIVYAAVERFPRYEAFGLTSQIQRAANAVPLLIAEGSALPSKPLFSHRLGLAQGELAEVVSACYLARDREYLDETTRVIIYEAATGLARQIAGLRRPIT